MSKEKDASRAVGDILIKTNVAAMKEVAHHCGLLTAGDKIDLRGRKVKFRHTGLDLRELVLDGCDLSDSSFVNCIGETASFRNCILRKTRIAAEKAAKVSFRGASFDGATIAESYLGPRTVDLSGTSYCGATLSEVTFMLSRLVGSDFSGAVLTDVYFRSGLLNDVKFRGARLTRVSFEQATLVGADFTGATFEEMEFWGEPNYEGVTIDDELRYQFGEVREPRRRIEALIESGELGEDTTAAARAMSDAFADLLSYPEAMLIGREMERVAPPHLFRRILKALKTMPSNLLRFHSDWQRTLHRSFESLPHESPKGLGFWEGTKALAL